MPAQLWMRCLSAGAAAWPSRRLCSHFATALDRNRFGQLPFRHGFDGTVSTLLLARSGRAQLIHHAREPGRTDFSSAGFSDALRYEAVLAG